jgi:hypothetical protein
MSNSACTLLIMRTCANDKGRPTFTPSGASVVGTDAGSVNAPAPLIIRTVTASPCGTVTLVS